MARDPGEVAGTSVADGISVPPGSQLRLPATSSRLPQPFTLQQDYKKGQVGFQQRLLAGHAVLVVRVAYSPPRRDIADTNPNPPPNDGELVMALDQFMMTDVVERDTEKTANIYTLGDPVTYTGGRTPRLFQYVGVLVKDRIHGSGGPRWVRAYEEFMRARAAAEAGYRCSLYFLDQVRHGYIVQYNLAQDANDQARMTFGFSMFAVSDRG